MSNPTQTALTALLKNVTTLRRPQDGPKGAKP